MAVVGEDAERCQAVRRAGRMGASLLTRLRLTDFVTSAPEQYVSVAAQLAQELNRQRVLHFAGSPPPPGEVENDCPADPFRRVPRVTADVLGARPIDLAIIDGIETNRGGEGPWVRGVEAIKPGLLMVGLNAVCTDSVCTAVMGYDPMADHGKFPPFQGDNHLRLLAERGVGTNDPRKIEVRGLSIQEALFPFNPQKLPLPLRAQTLTTPAPAAMVWVETPAAHRCPAGIR